jgi:hypothetical protein
MFAALLIAAAIIHAPSQPPAAQLAAVQRAATFHVMVLPSSMQLLRAEVNHDGSAVRIEYSVEGAVVTIDERPSVPAEAPRGDGQGELFNLNGYPAYYRESSGYREPSSLTWYRSEITVILSSRDRVNAPLLVDIALELF